MRDDRYVDIYNLVKAYPNPFGDEIKVVDGFELKVPRGDVVSIIGHSGCGKSTVLNMIAGLIPISDGGIIVAGKEIDGPGPDRAVVFQAPCLLPWMTSFQNVMLGVKRSYPHASKKERAAMVESALCMVGLADSMHKYPREMSGGMQQRVGIARAIALKPRMLLLDEPLGRLDSLTRMELQDVILRILDKEKITTMIITHDPDEAVYMSDRICMMTNGPHAKVGEVMEIDFERPRNREEIVETDLFYDYRRRLLKFLDDCEAEKEERRQLKKAKASSEGEEPVKKAS
ncbi:ABC transporter ATP-binding protein [Coraliomargarita akajimensis]|uniref:Nitrate ABC transporter, ATPase subunits C and D n=1 Tax=Coraliomargarita akajimensis (strain DSM 45221 / IAM 15411 / JCM 23193 / KCTC 12865 / 04OKA010-24) TaxID=583355 RepID=D5EMG2_CORAD|nr:ABC transporter ATP-binding protein [Coraliomargarita akajimensis]ADE53368.1 nitrate ABC transporter, ATPase subunits C and D [Coraliomargarita akajimensis DSM 45221]